MAQTAALNEDIRDIGMWVFERADAAQPNILQKSWWLEKMTHLVESDEYLKTRAFQFVECLPTLQNDATLMRHIREYLVHPSVPLPSLFDHAVSPGALQTLREHTIGAFARLGATQMAGRFIAGRNGQDAIKTIERLRAKNMAFTLDVLGELTNDYPQADRYAQTYLDLIDVLTSAAKNWPLNPLIDEDEHGLMSPVNLSIKLTSLDPYFDAIDPRRCMREVCGRLRPILRRAKEAGAFVNIDMESFKVRDITLRLFKDLLMEDEFRDWVDIGIVVQAYLADGENDLVELLEWGEKRGTRFAIRLVKGAYWDAETAVAVRNHKKPPVWTRKWESDACYERMTRTMLENTRLIRPAFASHNVRSLAAVIATAKKLGLTSKHYELQQLYGMGDPLKTALVDQGQCVRVYLPCGELMPGMGYLIRRLLENTSNDGFLKQAFGDRTQHDRLLADPAIAQPPSVALPTRHYVNTDPEEPMSAFVNASNTNFSSEENRRKMINAFETIREESGKVWPLVIGEERIKVEKTYTSANPAKPAESIGLVSLATTADADRAVAAAGKAFKAWRTTCATERADLLRKLAERMAESRLLLAGTMVLECGKPWREADADVTEAIDHCRYYAEQIERMVDRPRRRNVPGEDNVLTYSPKGVCAVVSPWSFPLAILTGMTTAALAGGNAVVIKPALRASIAAARLFELMSEVGFPAGAINFVTGDETIGAHLIEHGDVQVVAFTGTSHAGIEVIGRGAKVRPGQSFIKKMIVEMGGKNAIIIDDDADMDGAVRAVMESAFIHAGQKCSSCSRVVVVEGAYDDFCDRLVKAVDGIPVGPAELPATWVGPVIDEDVRKRIQEFIEKGKQEARPLYEGKLPAEAGDGFFVPPVVFGDVPPDATIAQEEIFGPVLCVLRAKNFDDALTIANNTRYALTGGLFSRSPAHIEQARRDFEVGNLYINRKIIGSQVDVQPFGGFKFSGTGVKAGSPDYLAHFMDARCITENTLRSGMVADEEHEEAVHAR